MDRHGREERVYDSKPGEKAEQPQGKPGCCTPYKKYKLTTHKTSAGSDGDKPRTTRMTFEISEQQWQVLEETCQRE